MSRQQFLALAHVHMPDCSTINWPCTISCHHRWGVLNTKCSIWSLLLFKLWMMPSQQKLPHCIKKGRGRFARYQHQLDSGRRDWPILGLCPHVCIWALHIKNNLVSYLATMGRWLNTSSVGAENRESTDATSKSSSFFSTLMPFHFSLTIFFYTSAAIDAKVTTNIDTSGNSRKYS